MTLKVIVCDVAFLNDASLAGDKAMVSPGSWRFANPYFERFLSLAKAGDKRITLLSGRFEDLADAIPDLVAQTERERHAERIQRLHATGNA